VHNISAVYIPLRCCAASDSTRNKLYLFLLYRDRRYRGRPGAWYIYGIRSSEIRVLFHGMLVEVDCLGGSADRFRQREG
jgi:hypothetical protein